MNRLWVLLKDTRQLLRLALLCCVACAAREGHFIQALRRCGDERAVAKDAMAAVHKMTDVLFIKAQLNNGGHLLYDVLVWPSDG